MIVKSNHLTIPFLTSSSSWSVITRMFLLLFMLLVANINNNIQIVHGRSITVDGDDNSSNLQCITKVPNVLGWVDVTDPPIIVNSDVPVSILRYNDNIYLDGMQPIMSDDIYIVVKTNCTTTLSSDMLPEIQYEQSPRLNVEWDDNSYTNKITISAATATASDTGSSTAEGNTNNLNEFLFMEPSTYFAEYSYTGFWCRSFQFEQNSTPTTTDPNPTNPPSSSPTVSPTTSPPTSPPTSTAELTCKVSMKTPTKPDANVGIDGGSPTSGPIMTPSETMTPTQGDGDGSTTAPPSSGQVPPPPPTAANPIDGGENSAGNRYYSVTFIPIFVTSVVTTVLAGIVTSFTIGGRNQDENGVITVRRKRNMALLIGLTLVVVVVVAAGTAIPGAANVSMDRVSDIPRKRSSSSFVENDTIEVKKQGKNSKQERKLQQQNEQCTINVEILLDGCRRHSWNIPDGQDQPNPDLIVSAPAVRVLDVDLDETNQYQDPNDICTTHYEATLTFPTSIDDDVDIKVPVIDESALPRNTVVGGESMPYPVVNVPSLTEGCGRAVEGRPYVANGGQRVQATVSSSPSSVEAVNDAHSWSFRPKDVSTPSDVDIALGKVWTERALGEHASVPAFASFTIALMSNGAPPSLIEDALTAAMDEVRHAKTSFEIASMLSGQSIEPGPLPQSKVQFGSNMTALALAAAQEGCVDETLSALVAGLEVHTHIDKNNRLSQEMKAFLKEKIRIIAMEETRHSALAWRTVQWACRVDPNACSTFKENVFRPDHLDRTFRERFKQFGGGEMVQSAHNVWERIYETLIPIVLSEKIRLEPANCDGDSFDRELLQEMPSTSSSFLDEMANAIVSHVRCQRDTTV